MSGRRNKRERRKLRRIYEGELAIWKWREPPWWRLIAHWRWRRSKPEPPDGRHRDGSKTKL